MPKWEAVSEVPSTSSFLPVPWSRCIMGSFEEWCGNVGVNCFSRRWYVYLVPSKWMLQDQKKGMAWVLESSWIRKSSVPLMARRWFQMTLWVVSLPMPITTINQEWILPKGSLVQWKKQRDFHSDRTGLRSSHSVAYVTLDKWLNLSSLNFIIYWLCIEDPLCLQHCSKHLGYIGKQNRQMPALMKITIFRDVGMVGRPLNLWRFMMLSTQS